MNCEINHSQTFIFAILSEISKTEIRNARVILVIRGKSKAQNVRTEVYCNSAMTNETLKSNANGNIRGMKSLQERNYFRVYSAVGDGRKGGGGGRGRQVGRRKDEEYLRAQFAQKFDFETISHTTVCK